MIGAILAVMVDTALLSDKVTTRQLRGACAATNAPANLRLCQAFVVSGANTMLDPHGSFRQICAVPTATFGQFRKTFLSYVERHPEEIERPAVIVILEAFEAAFPCSQKEPKARQ